MKRLLILIAIVVSLSSYGQGTFQYCTMRNNIWGKWVQSENPFDCYLINKVGDYEWIIYRYNQHPANYLFKLTCANLHIDKDKKSRRAHLKNNIWYEYTGSVEIFTDAETFAKDFPLVASHDKPEIKSNVLPARISVEPYKNHPKVLNIYFDDYGFAIMWK